MTGNSLVMILFPSPFVSFPFSLHCATRFPRLNRTGTSTHSDPNLGLGRIQSVCTKALALFTEQRTTCPRFINPTFFFSRFPFHPSLSNNSPLTEFTLRSTRCWATECLSGSLWFFLPQNDAILSHLSKHFVTLLRWIQLCKCNYQSFKLSLRIRNNWLWLWVNAQIHCD